MTSTDMPYSTATASPTGARPDPTAAPAGAATAVDDDTVDPDTAEGIDGADTVTLIEANSTIKNYVIASMALGLVPVPVFDIVAVVATQLKMIHSLTRLYGIRFSENVAKSLILSLIGGVLPVTLGAGFASVLKFVPGLGSFAGGASVSILSGALTYAVGRIFVQHFESGGTLLDFDPSKVRDRFRAEFRKGQTAAQDLEDEVEAAAATQA